jgi:pimeloyl-ACP methyl ester carboxylesterase
MHYLHHQGVKLAYDVAGYGNPPIVLVHGWCDNHNVFARIADHFSQRHLVISVDLRGHGHSDKPLGDYAIATFAEDVAWMCTYLELPKPLMIGHSLGGAIVLEFAQRYPTLPLALVAIEGVILPPAHIQSGGRELLGALRSPAWRDVIHGFVESNFSPTDDPALREQALANLETLPQHMHISVTEQMLRWDAVKAVHNCKVPLLYIEGGSGLSDLNQLQALCSQLSISRTVGLGHMQMLATPHQVNSQIEAFMAKLAVSR